MDNNLEFSSSISPILRNYNNINEPYESRILNRNILNSTVSDFLELEKLKEINNQLVGQNILISNRLNRVISEYEYYVSKINENKLDHRYKNSIININKFIFFLYKYFVFKIKGVEKTDNEKKFNKDHPAYTWNQNSIININKFIFFLFKYFVFKIKGQNKNF